MTHHKMTSARAALILDQPFFGVLALRLALLEDPTCETAWVNGRELGYNPEFVESVSHQELTALLAHEVMHCADGHPWRRDHRDQDDWNVACDLAINPILTDAGFVLPECALHATSEQQGKSAEWIFSRLPKKPPPQQSGGKDKGNSKGKDDAPQDGTPTPGKGSPGQQEKKDPLGEVRDAPQDTSEDENAPTEESWRQATQQAAQAAQSQGRLPGGAERWVKQAKESHVNWRSVLHRFVQEIARADYSWTRPNPRYLTHGLYLPGLRSEEMGPLAVAIDTSGSIDETLLSQFTRELQAVAEEMHPRRVHILSCDAAVKWMGTFERDEPIEIQPSGGGGTNFCPAFHAIAEFDEAPVCIVYLTDLRGTFPKQAPEAPVLWVTSPQYAHKQVPFGEVVVADT